MTFTPSRQSRKRSIVHCTARASSYWAFRHTVVPLRSYHESASVLTGCSFGVCSSVRTAPKAYLETSILSRYGSIASACWSIGAVVSSVFSETNVCSYAEPHCHGAFFFCRHELLKTKIEKQLFLIFRCFISNMALIFTESGLIPSRDIK